MLLYRSKLLLYLQNEHSVQNVFSLSTIILLQKLKYIKIEEFVWKRKCNCI